MRVNIVGLTSVSRDITHAKYESGRVHNNWKKVIENSDTCQHDTLRTFSSSLEYESLL